MILFLAIGIFGLLTGLLIIFSRRFNEYLHGLFGESKLDKKLFSDKDRYFLRRYVTGLKGVIAGLAAIAFWYFSRNSEMPILTSDVVIYLGGMLITAIILSQAVSYFVNKK